MKSPKYYVVWKGREPGVFNNWEECKQQIFEFQGAIYKSFPTLEEAQQAFKNKPHIYLTKTNSSIPTNSNHKPILNSLCVDGACSSATGQMEYQCVHTQSREIIFKQGPYKTGTNNIAEFLALVHVLALCKQKNCLLPIYSDSHTAMVWVKNKKSKTTLENIPENKEILDLIERAEKWLANNTWQNSILKWDTKAWGEIPADFGRK